MYPATTSLTKRWRLGYVGHPDQPVLEIFGLAVHSTARDGARTAAHVAFVGELCAYTAPYAWTELAATVETVDDLVLDLSGVTFCGAAGVGLLCRLRSAQRRRGATLSIVAASRQVIRTVTICEREDVLEPVRASTPESVTPRFVRRTTAFRPHPRTTRNVTA